MTAAALFDDGAMAAGYARDRPPVHPHLVDRFRAGPARPSGRGLAVDVGCGAGASTAALRGLTDRGVGFDPYAPMVAAAARVAADLPFAVAAAEALPLPVGRVDLLAAAGSLNYARLDAFVREADRVLAPEGVVVVSNYGFGRPVAVDPTWPDRFAARWPRPASRPVDAASFAGGPFGVVVDERFVVTLPMTPAAYVAYLMTETSVAQAVRDGGDALEVQRWCEDALRPEFGVEQDVAFDATLLVLRR
jgi:SAM-dependent methyltransferase